MNLINKLNLVKFRSSTDQTFRGIITKVFVENRTEGEARRPFIMHRLGYYYTTRIVNKGRTIRIGGKCDHQRKLKQIKSIVLEIILYPRLNIREQ